LLLLTLGLPAVRADVIKTVSVDTVGLGFLGTGPYSLAFELADGSGTADGNNSVVLSNFQFGAGGSASGSPLLIGSALGDLSSAVTLTDSDFANIFVQSFVPGDTLSFLLSFTTNVDAGSPADEFIFSILDGSFSPIPTNSASPLFPFLAIDLDSASPAILTFSSPFVAAPAVGNPAGAAVPEPSSAVLILLPLAGLAWKARRKPALR